MPATAWWAQSTEITDDMVAKAQSSVGGSGPIRNQWNRAATRDTIFHAAIGSGDDNPLWIDEDYARASRWGTRLAPPAFYQSMAYGTRYPMDKVGKPKPKSMLSGLPGIGGYPLGVNVTWHGPIREGESFASYGRSLGAIDSQGRRAGDCLDEAELDLATATEVAKTYLGNWRARTLLQVGELTIMREPAQELAVRIVEFNLRVPRGLPVDEGPYAGLSIPVYSDEEVTELLTAYREQTRRGGEPLDPATLTVGEPLPGRTHGPLTLTSMRAYAAAVGSNFAMGDSLLFRYLANSPKASVPHPGSNVPDVPNRIHWDDDAAATMGYPRGSDFSATRVFWAGSYITDWIGDNGYLHNISLFFPRPLFLWDTHTLVGHVTAIEPGAGSTTLRFGLEARNRAGEVVTFGAATAIMFDE